MKRQRILSVLTSMMAAAAFLVVAGCGSGGGGIDGQVDEAAVLAAKKNPGPVDPGEASERGVQPTAYTGNFVSSDDDQVCYDMSQLGYIGAYSSEMRGFKIDPPAAYNDGYVDVTLQAGGILLDWEALNNAQVLAFIVKGGPNYNVFNYVNTGFEWDQGLGSPMQGKNRPAISHYNVCYSVPSGSGDQGCTPGYWRNHADRWLGVAPSDDFDTTFGVDLFTPDVTLGWAIWANGGGNNALARHATAALLNAYGGVPNGDGSTVAYRWTPAEVIKMVQDAVAEGTGEAIEAAKDAFADENERGCPLSGTRRVDAPQ